MGFSSNNWSICCNKCTTLCKTWLLGDSGAGGEVYWHSGLPARFSYKTAQILNLLIYKNSLVEPSFDMPQDLCWIDSPVTPSRARKFSPEQHRTVSNKKETRQTMVSSCLSHFLVFGDWAWSQQAWQFCPFWGSAYPQLLKCHSGGTQDTPPCWDPTCECAPVPAPALVLLQMPESLTQFWLAELNGIKKSETRSAYFGRIWGGLWRAL